MTLLRPALPLPLALTFSPPFSDSKANQDRALVAHPMRCAPGQRQALFVVCDGHGSKGEFASEFVTRSIVGQVRSESGAPRCADGSRTRANSWTCDDEHNADSFEGTRSPQSSRLRRSGSLRAARTQRVYSDPPTTQALTTSVHSHGSFRSDAASSPPNRERSGSLVVAPVAHGAPAPAAAVLSAAGALPPPPSIIST